MLTDNVKEIEEIWNEATTLHGDSYDKRQIFIYYAWVKWFKRKATKWVNAFKNNKYTCNEFVIIACRAGLAGFLKLDFSYTPEGLYRHFYGEPSK